MVEDRDIHTAIAAHLAGAVAALQEVGTDRDPDTGATVSFSTPELVVVRCGLCPRGKARKVAVVVGSPWGPVFTDLPSVTGQPLTALLDQLREDPVVRSFFHTLWTNPELSRLRCKKHGGLPVPPPLSLLRALDAELEVLHTPPHDVVG